MSSILQVEEPTLKKKELSSNKFCCVAASPFNTIIGAYAAFVENKSGVYLIDHEINGHKKCVAYKRCCKSLRPTEKSDIHEISGEKSNTGDDNSLKLCHRHQNAKSLKIFDIDILPNARLATEDDSYFKSMGIRGAKKKNGNNTYVFDSPKNPILEILNHPNRNYFTSLMIEALKIQKKSSGNKDISNLVSLLNNETKSTHKYHVDSDKDDSEEDDSDQEIDLYKDSPDTENISLVSDDEEEVSCEAIFTTNGDQLWYNPSDNKVYEPADEDDNSKNLGILKEISSKYETIQYNSKSYTVMIELNHEEKGEIHCCVLSNRLFKLHDKNNFKLIGKRILIKSSSKSADKKYKLVFNEKI
jgi:hypothetical protein